MNGRAWVKRMLPYWAVTAIARCINRPWLEDVHRTERLTEYTWVLKHMQEGWTLDFGSASSYFPEMLAQWGRVDTCDFRAWPKLRHPNIEFVGTPPMRGGYQNITCVSVLEHYLPQEETVQDLIRRLGVGGQLLMTYPTTLWQPKKFRGYQEIRRLWSRVSSAGAWSTDVFVRTRDGWVPYGEGDPISPNTEHQVNVLGCTRFVLLTPHPSLMT